MRAGDADRTSKALLRGSGTRLTLSRASLAPTSLASSSRDTSKATSLAEACLIAIETNSALTGASSSSINCAIRSKLLE